MDLPQLRAASPDLLRAGAAAFARGAQTLARITDRLELEILRPLMDGSWQGRANAAAVAYIEQVWKNLVHARADLERADRAVWQFSEAVAAAQRMVADAERIVESAQLVLNPDGSVQFPPLPFPVPAEEVRAMQAAAERVSLLLSEALQGATEADQTCARAIAELVADLVGAGPSGGGPSGGGPSGSGGGGDGLSIGDLIGTAWDGLSWTSSISSFIEANWGIGGLGSRPVLGKVLAAVSGIGAVQGVLDLVEQGNPIEAYQDRGAEYVADWFETAFNTSSFVTAVVPNPFTGAAVVATGIGWAVADNWNSIPFHDNIEDAAEWTGDRIGDGWDLGTAVAEGYWEAGTETMGAVLDTGGDLFSATGDLFSATGDALSTTGNVLSTGADLLGL